MYPRVPVLRVQVLPTLTRTWQTRTRYPCEFCRPVVIPKYKKHAEGAGKDAGGER